MELTAQFENYILDHFQVDRVSNGTQFLLHDDCPFCSSSGKVYIDRRKGVGICHKCGQGFGPAKFVAEHLGITTPQARKVLSSGKTDAWKELEEEPEEIPVPAVWFPPTIPVTSSNEAMAYMTGRGINEEMISRFGITYCQENVQAGEKLYWTSNRIIIPLFDKDGSAVGWQGRDITGNSYIRYLFMPGFKGADNLFNIGSIQPGGYVIMCEGVFDVFGWVKSGVNNVVGTYGKKISAVQIDMLAALNSKVLYVAWDGDANKEKYRFIENHGHLFNKISMIDLEDKDADECDKEALFDAISRASSYNWSNKILTLL